MKNKLRLISIFCALVMALSCFAAFPAVAVDNGPSWATEGGTGTQADPYILNNDNFLTFYNATAGLSSEDTHLGNGNVYIKLNEDIVLNKGWTASSTAPMESTVEAGVTPSVWTAPIGAATNVRAHFDGGNHTISGIYMKTTTRYAGLFGILIGSVSNLKIINSYFENDSAHEYSEIGSFASRLKNGTVENCYSDAIIVVKQGAKSTAGGIVGLSDYGTTYIKNSVFNGRVESNQSAGGILGKINWSNGSYVANVSDCLNLGSVRTSGNFAGGIVGNENTNETVNISNCINANPNIINTATATSIGDIVGSAYSANNTVTNTYVVNGLRNSSKLIAKDKRADECTGWAVTEIQINDLYNEATMKAKGFTDWTYANGSLPVPTSKKLNVQINANEYVINNVDVGLDFVGASVRIEDVSGIRFITDVNVEVLNALKAVGDVKFGTYITKAEFLKGVDAPEFEYDAENETIKGTNYVCLDVYAGDFFEGKQIAGTIAKVHKVTDEYAGRAYVKITLGDVTREILAEFDVNTDVRSVSDVAKAALDDVEDTNEGKYTNPLSLGETYYVDGVVTTVETENSVFSRYDSDQRETLRGLIGGVTVEVEKTELNIDAFYADDDGTSTYMKWAQGGCTDGTYLYQFMIDEGSTECVIVKMNPVTGDIEKSGKLALGHANDAAYNPDNKTIAVADCTDTNGYYNTVYILDAEELTIKETITVMEDTQYAPIAAITYDVSNHQYITANETKLYFWNANFEFVKEISAPHLPIYGYEGETPLYYANQGIDCDGTYIYRLAYHQDSQGEITNCLIINDMNGNLIETIDLEISVETENIAQINGEFYVTCNNENWNGTETYLVKLEIKV